MEIEHFFSLSEDELAAVQRRRTVLNRLALALQIGFLKMTGGALNSVEIIPTGVLEHLVAADRRGLHRPARAQHQNRAPPASKRWSVVSILGQTLTGDRGFESVSLQR
jgi:hypothetical protein